MTKSFILYQEYKENLKMLSQNQKGDLLDAIFAYNEGEEMILEPIVKMAFSFIKSNLERNKIKYENIIERNKINGLKGGRPTKPKKPSGLNENPEKPKETLNDNDNEDVNVDKDKDKEENKDLESKSEFQSQFETFWESYKPIKTTDGKIVNKGDKKLAQKSFNREIGNHTLQVILDGLKRYLEDCQRNNILSCQAVVFLNQQRFLREEVISVEAKNLKPISAADEWKGIIDKMDQQNNKQIIQLT